MRENGGSLNLNFILLLTKSCGRWDLGLPTSSAAVLPLKMMPCMMFQSIQTFSVIGKFTECYHSFCAQIDLLFTIFVCSHYRPWATIRLLHHFGFVMCVNSRLYCMHFSCHWRKIRNVLSRLTQISKTFKWQCDPCMLLIIIIVYLFMTIQCTVYLYWFLSKKLLFACWQNWGNTKNTK